MLHIITESTFLVKTNNNAKDIVPLQTHIKQIKSVFTQCTYLCMLPILVNKI